ncbi:hypothetical protein [Rasiella sp. SM2506]|uniref:hypothetical protein n=1 Tax=Rasiella sp. SM2506 TaxID=3423914 RepID=UPI003D7A8E0D
MKHIFVVFLLLSVIGCNEKKQQADNESVEKTVVENTKNDNVVSLNNPSEENSQLPRLYSNGTEIYFSWVTKKDTTNFLNYSKYNGTDWTPKTLVATGNDWFVNWADFPALAENNGTVLTNLLQKSADGTYTYDVKLNLFKDSATIKNNFILHNDATKSEHGFVSILPYKDDGFFITWLDGRNTAGGHDMEGEHGTGGAMTLRSAIVDGKGTISQRTELDNRVCDCCQTSAAMTANGPVVVYRDRSEEEVRDISIVRNVNGTWTQPQTVGLDNWKIAACPVNGPSVDAIDNVVAVAWFTVTKGVGDAKVVFSQDGGATFTTPFSVSTESATGRVDIVVLDAAKKEAALIWMQPKGEDEVIYLLKVNEKGSIGTPVIISQTSPERASGFPQLEKVGNELFLAWTEVDQKITTIKTAIISIDKL